MNLKQYREEIDKQCMEIFLVGINDMFDDKETEQMFKDNENIKDAVVAKGEKYNLDSVS